MPALTPIASDKLLFNVHLVWYNELNTFIPEDLNLITAVGT
jgi:hypothetical protein